MSLKTKLYTKNPLSISPARVVQMAGRAGDIMQRLQLTAAQEVARNLLRNATKTKAEQLLIQGGLAAVFGSKRYPGSVQPSQLLPSRDPVFAEKNKAFMTKYLRLVQQSEQTKCRFFASPDRNHNYSLIGLPTGTHAGRYSMIPLPVFADMLPDDPDAPADDHLSDDPDAPADDHSSDDPDAQADDIRGRAGLFFNDDEWLDRDNLSAGFYTPDLLGGGSIYDGNPQYDAKNLFARVKNNAKEYTGIDNLDVESFDLFTAVQAQLDLTENPFEQQIAELEAAQTNGSPNQIDFSKEQKAVVFSDGSKMALHYGEITPQGEILLTIVVMSPEHGTPGAENTIIELPIVFTPANQRDPARLEAHKQAATLERLKKVLLGTPVMESDIGSMGKTSYIDYVDLIWTDPDGKVIREIQLQQKGETRSNYAHTEPESLEADTSLDQIAALVAKHGEPNKIHCRFIDFDNWEGMDPEDIVNRSFEGEFDFTQALEELRSTDPEYAGLSIEEIATKRREAEQALPS